MPKSEVIVDWKGDEYVAELEKAIERGIGHGMEVVVSAARSAPTKYRIHQAILATIRATPVKTREGGRRGRRIYSLLIAPDFRALWFEKGTLARRRTKLKKSTLARRSSSSGQARFAKVQDRQGVKAQRFLAHGLRVGWPGFLERLRKELPR